MSICSDSSHITSGSSYSRMSDDSKSSSGRSQMHWKMFRKDVLAPHHIRILETSPGVQLPDAVVEWANANRENVGRFTRQRKFFRKQVAHGRGFGDSALFPHEVLPWTRGQPFIAKCMVPTFSAEPLPERKVRDETGRLGLSPPQPGFACGFSSSAFGPEELRSIPNFLATSGTTLQFDTGSITPDSALYCPFMTFERTFHQQKYALEIAANQCAINGAWCIRSLQMLHAQATGNGSPITEFEDLVSFTCAIDNNIAIINYHWVDHAHTFCMAPIIKFELSRDDHFNQFLIWIEAIGHWAVGSILPEVKKAISLITEDFSEELALIKPMKVSQHPTNTGEQSLFSALKLSYDNIPWNLEKDDASGCSSSTASWGSPMINEAVFKNMKYPINIQPSFQIPIHQLNLPKEHNPRPISVCSEPPVTKTVRFADVSPRAQAGIVLKPAIDTSVAPFTKAVPVPQEVPPQILAPQVQGEVAFDTNQDLLMKRRLGHAMDEIKDLHKQLNNMKAEFSGSTMCLQDELLGLRKSMTTVLRKERFSFKQGSPIRSNTQEGLEPFKNESIFSIEKDVSIVTTPTDPSARPMWQRANANTPRRPSGLQNVLALDTKVSTSVTTTQSMMPGSANVQQSADAFKTPASITIFSPTIINVSSNERKWAQNDDYDDEQEEDCGTLIRVPPSRSNTWSPVLTTHLLCTLMPSVLLRVIILGFIVDYCMVSFSGNQAVPLTHYIAHILENAVAV